MTTGFQPTSRLPVSGPDAATRRGERVRGAFAVLGTLAVVVGVPALLVLVVGNPLPTSLPSREWLTADISVEVVLKVVALVVWAVWAHFVVCLLVELRAARSGDGLPGAVPFGGGSQHLARKLVAAALLLAGTASLAPTGAVSTAPGEHAGHQRRGGGRLGLAVPGAGDADRPAAGRRRGRGHRAGQRRRRRGAGRDLLHGAAAQRPQPRHPLGHRRAHPRRPAALQGALPAQPRAGAARRPHAGRRRPDLPGLGDADAGRRHRPGPDRRRARRARRTRRPVRARRPRRSRPRSPRRSPSRPPAPSAASATTSSAGTEQGRDLERSLLGGGLLLAGVLVALTGRRGPYGAPGEGEQRVRLAADGGLAGLVDRALRSLAASRAADGLPLPEVALVFASREQVVLHLTAPSAPRAARAVDGHRERAVLAGRRRRRARRRRHRPRAVPGAGQRRQHRRLRDPRRPRGRSGPGRPRRRPRRRARGRRLDGGRAGHQRLVRRRRGHPRRVLRRPHRRGARAPHPGAGPRRPAARARAHLGRAHRDAGRARRRRRAVRPDRPRRRRPDPAARAAARRHAQHRPGRPAAAAGGPRPHPARRGHRGRPAHRPLAVRARRHRPDRPRRARRARAGPPPGPRRLRRAGVAGGRGRRSAGARPPPSSPRCPRAAPCRRCWATTTPAPPPRPSRPPPCSTSTSRSRCRSGCSARSPSRRPARSTPTASRCSPRSWSRPRCTPTACTTPCCGPRCGRAASATTSSRPPSATRRPGSGRTPDGAERLHLGDDGRWHLSADVRSDHAELAARAARAGGPLERDDLSTGLALVRGEAFDAPVPGRYGWLAFHRGARDARVLGTAVARRVAALAAAEGRARPRRGGAAAGSAAGAHVRGAVARPAPAARRRRPRQRLGRRRRDARGPGAAPGRRHRAGDRRPRRPAGSRVPPPLGLTCACSSPRSTRAARRTPPRASTSRWTARTTPRSPTSPAAWPSTSAWRCPRR